MKILDQVWSLLLSYSPYILILTVIGVIIAYKLRLLKKFGFYLAGVGACFFASGIIAVGNPILLLIGNLLFIAGIH